MGDCPAVYNVSRCSREREGEREKGRERHTHRQTDRAGVPSQSQAGGCFLDQWRWHSYRPTERTGAAPCRSSIASARFTRCARQRPLPKTRSTMSVTARQNRTGQDICGTLSRARCVCVRESLVLVRRDGNIPDSLCAPLTPLTPCLSSLVVLWVSLFAPNSSQAHAETASRLPPHFLDALQEREKRGLKLPVLVVSRSLTATGEAVKEATMEHTHSGCSSRTPQ